MPFMKSAAGALDLLQDVGGFGDPDEGFGLVIVMVDIFEDGVDQLLDTYGSRKCPRSYGPASPAGRCRRSHRNLRHS